MKIIKERKLQTSKKSFVFAPHEWSLTEMPLKIIFELGFRSEIFTSAHALSQSGGEDYRSMEKSQLIDVISVQRDIFL